MVSEGEKEPKKYIDLPVCFTNFTKESKINSCLLSSRGLALPNGVYSLRKDFAFDSSPFLRSSAKTEKMVELPRLKVYSFILILFI